MIHVHCALSSCIFYVIIPLKVTSMHLFTSECWVLALYIHLIPSLPYEFLVYCRTHISCSSHFSAFNLHVCCSNSLETVLGRSNGNIYLDFHLAKCKDGMVGSVLALSYRNIEILRLQSSHAMVYLQELIRLFLHCT